HRSVGQIVRKSNAGKMVLCVAMLIALGGMAIEGSGRSLIMEPKSRYSTPIGRGLNDECRRIHVRSRKIRLRTVRSDYDSFEYRRCVHEGCIQPAETFYGLPYRSRLDEPRLGGCRCLRWLWANSSGG